MEGRLDTAGGDRRGVTLKVKAVEVVDRAIEEAVLEYLREYLEYRLTHSHTTVHLNS